MKICFLFLAAVVTVGCAGMDNPQSAAILAQGFAHSADLYAAGARPVAPANYGFVPNPMPVVQQVEVVQPYAQFVPPAPIPYVR